MEVHQVQMSEPDQYGQRHPRETPELIKAKLQELELELANHVDAVDKDAFEQAKIKCPDQALCDKFNLLFLRCEVFNVNKAAQRLTKYWAKRLELFGPDKAFLPPTLSGVFHGNDKGMELGVSTLLPTVKDPSGRGVLLYDPSQQDNSLRQEMVQALWYCIHAALLDNEETQKLGMIGLVCPRYASLTQFDPRVDKLVMESVQGILPIRISCIVVSHPPAIFYNLIWPIVQLFLSDRILQRVRIMGGTDESVIQQLVESNVVGSSLDAIPELMGGNLHVDHLAWLESRRKEGK